MARNQWVGDCPARGNVKPMNSTSVVLIALVAFLLVGAPAVAEEEQMEPAEEQCPYVQVSPWDAPYVTLHPDCLQFP